MNGSVVEIGLAAAGLVLLAGVVAFAMRSGRRARVADAALFDRLASCYEDLARRHGLTVHRPQAEPHPVAGRAPVPPVLRGPIGRLQVQITVEDRTGEGDLDTVLRISAHPEDPDWPAAPDVLSAGARAAYDALRERSRRVELRPRTLTASPVVAASTDWNGRTRRILTDADSLDAWLALALDVVRSL